MELRFEEFNPEMDLIKQHELYIECFPETIGTSSETLEHYQWKFHSGPFNPKSFEYIVKNETGDIIGYYAALPYLYCINGESTRCGMVCDVMTGVKARGKGIFTKLGQYSTTKLADAGIPFTTGYPIRKGVIPGHLRAGWKIVFKLPLYMRILKLNSFPFFRRFRPLVWLLNPIMYLYQSICSFSINKYEVLLHSNKTIDEINGYNDFFNEWASNKPNYLIKSKEFLTWRLNGPGKEYKLITLYHNGKLSAIAIVRSVIKENIPSLAILDFMANEKDKYLLKALHKEILKYARMTNAHAILTMMSPYWKANYRLYTNGYFRSPFTFSLIIKKLSEYFSDEILFTEKSWHLMWIDSDDL